MEHWRLPYFTPRNYPNAWTADFSRSLWLNDGSSASVIGGRTIHFVFFLLFFQLQGRNCLYIYDNAPRLYSIWSFVTFAFDMTTIIVHCVTRGRSVCFYGEGKHFPNRRNDHPRVTHDTFFDILYDFGIFRTHGSVPQLCFSKLQSGGKTLIWKRLRWYTHIVKGTNCAKFRI